MAKVTLSDRYIASPQRVPAEGRVDYHDALVPGLALRVTARGHRSFVLITRYPLHPKNPSRRMLGDCFIPPRDHDPGRHAPQVPIQDGALTLGEAREKARVWLALIQRGVDPKTDAARKRAAEQRQQVNSFRAVAAAFIERHVDGLAKAGDARHTIEVEFVKRWGDRPITDILPEEAAEAIRAIVKRGAPYQAHNALGYLRRLFGWAIGTHEFGITMSPAERLRPKDLIGKREARERILLDDELRTVWQATSGLIDADSLNEARRRDRPRDAEAPIGYPYGPAIHMLIVTGQRLREVAEMDWSEVDIDKRLWTIPAARMKGDRAHQVPLAPMALALLMSLPRFNKGSFVFTTTSGEKPINGFSKTKERLDERITLGRAKIGEQPIPPWVFHDLRRTARTHFSALPVQDIVRELVIAHAKPGLHRVYDQHVYQDEKRECLTLWEQRLSAILAAGLHSGSATPLC